MIIPLPAQDAGYLENVLDHIYPALCKQLDGLTLTQLMRKIDGVQLTEAALQLGVARGTLQEVPGTDRFRISFDKWVETEAKA